jgi:hypothetical protein
MSGGGAGAYWHGPVALQLPHSDCVLLLSGWPTVDMTLLQSKHSRQVAAGDLAHIGRVASTAYVKRGTQQAFLHIKDGGQQPSISCG